jgi:hypothetical protein
MSSEPSSVSSTGTVVPLQQQSEQIIGVEQVDDLQGISTDPRSLPQHVQVIKQSMHLLKMWLATLEKKRERERER